MNYFVLGVDDEGQVVFMTRRGFETIEEALAYLSEDPHALHGDFQAFVAQRVAP
jgi:hypothetical protein